MSNFYHYKYHEVLNLEHREFEFLYECMEKAKAVERINDLDLHQYPYEDKNQKRKIHKKLYNKALPENDKKQKILSTSDLIKSGFLNGR